MHPLIGYVLLTEPRAGQPITGALRVPGLKRCPINSPSLTASLPCPRPWPPLSVFSLHEFNFARALTAVEQYHLPSLCLNYFTQHNVSRFLYTVAGVRFAPQGANTALYGIDQ